MTAKTPGRLGTIEDGSERLKVTPLTVRRMISAGELTGYRIGKRRAIRVDLDEIDALLTPIRVA